MKQIKSLIWLFVCLGFYERLIVVVGLLDNFFFFLFYFGQADYMHWLVDKIPDQALLNTAGWKHIVPQLYKQYPNDDMDLNISVSAPPLIKVTNQGIGATIYADVIVDVLDAGEVIPVACISLVC